MNHPVEIPHVDTELHGAGCDNYAIAPVSKSSFCVTALFCAQRTVLNKSVNTLSPEVRGKFLRPGPAVAKNEAFFASVEKLENLCGISKTADEINRDIRLCRGCTGWRYNYCIAGRSAGEPL